MKSAQYVKNYRYIKACEGGNQLNEKYQHQRRKAAGGYRNDRATGMAAAGALGWHGRRDRRRLKNPASAASAAAKTGKQAGEENGEGEAAGKYLRKLSAGRAEK